MTALWPGHAERQVPMACFLPAPASLQECLSSCVLPPPLWSCFQSRSPGLGPSSSGRLRWPQRQTCVSQGSLLTTCPDGCTFEHPGLGPGEMRRPPRKWSCSETWGPMFYPELTPSWGAAHPQSPAVSSLREVLEFSGAHEWESSDSATSSVTVHS